MLVYANFPVGPRFLRDCATVVASSPCAAVPLIFCCQPLLPPPARGWGVGLGKALLQVSTAFVLDFLEVAGFFDGLTMDILPVIRLGCTKYFSMIAMFLRLRQRSKKKYNWTN